MIRLPMTYTYYLTLNQGDYLERRGEWDWGRCGRDGATRFRSHKEAHQWARMLRSFGARVCREIGG